AGGTSMLAPWRSAFADPSVSASGAGHCVEHAFRHGYRQAARPGNTLHLIRVSPGGKPPKALNLPGFRGCRDAHSNSEALFPGVPEWDNLSLRIAVYYVQVIAEERITGTEHNAGRKRGFRVSGWRERGTTELPIVGRDSESSFKPSE